MVGYKLMETKIAIALPTNRGLKPKTLQSLMELVAYKPYSYEILVATEGFNTAENRTWLVAQAGKRDCTHVFFVDDDMIYEKDTLEKLLAHDKDIVGARYANRRGSGEVIGYLGERVEGEELFECAALGGGCVLVKMDVFKKLPQPWFWYKIAPTGAVLMSHDWFFCELARNNGYQVWCDPTINPGHIGKKEF
jgi:GT2 family glycosyltransferase